MGFMPGDDRARDAYDDWCTAMGGTDADGRVLPRWDRLTGQEQAAWETVTESAGTAAVRAAAVMNSPTAGMYGGGASGVSGAAGVTGVPGTGMPYPAAGYSGGYASAVPSMSP